MLIPFGTYGSKTPKDNVITAILEHTAVKLSLLPKHVVNEA